MTLSKILPLHFDGWAGERDWQGNKGIAHGIHSTLGSFFLGLGATCLWLQSVDAFTVLSVASLGAALVRLLSSIFDRSITVKNIGGVVAEAFLSALFLLSWV